VCPLKFSLLTFLLPLPMQLGAIGANQTVINDLYPTLVPLITESLKSVRGPIDIFSALGGSPHWRKQFPADGCGPGGPEKPCEWYCSDEGLTGCDQCHPADSGYTRMAQAVLDALEAAQGAGSIADSKARTTSTRGTATSVLSLVDGEQSANARAIR